MLSLWAVEYARRYNWHVRVWLDCQSVLSKYLLLMHGSREVRASMPHFDLWTKVVEIAGEIGWQRIQLVKVPAHEDPADAESSFEHWVIRGNTFADTAAKQANLQRSPVVWRCWEQHSHAIHVHRWLADEVRKHIVQVAARWTKQSNVEEPVEQSRSYGQGLRLPALHWPMHEPLSITGRRFYKLFGAEFAIKVLTWFNGLWSSQFPVRWVSYLQLFVIFQHQLADSGVAKIEGRWIRFEDYGAATPEQFHVTLRTKWFRLMLQQLMKDCQCAYTSATTRPWSSVLKTHIGCLAFPLDPELLSSSDQWLSSFERPALGHCSRVSRISVPHG